jgi:hypothetical protein
MKPLGHIRQNILHEVVSMTVRALRNDEIECEQALLTSLLAAEATPDETLSMTERIRVHANRVFNCDVYGVERDHGREVVVRVLEAVESEVGERDENDILLNSMDVARITKPHTHRERREGAVED